MRWRSSIKIFKRDFKQKEEKLNAEILTLKQQINKMREDNNKEENDLKRKKQQTDSFYADNINQYDEIHSAIKKSNLSNLVFKNIILVCVKKDVGENCTVQDGP